MPFLKAYVAALVSFLVIDIAWITIVAKPIYERSIGELMRESPVLGVAAAFYVGYVAGVVVLASLPARTARSGLVALRNGAILGAMAYGSFTMTNFTFLNAWTVELLVTDILWGTFVTAVIAWCGFFVIRNTANESA